MIVAAYVMVTGQCGLETDAAGTTGVPTCAVNATAGATVGVDVAGTGVDAGVAGEVAAADPATVGLGAGVDATDGLAPAADRLAVPGVLVEHAASNTATIANAAMRAARDPRRFGAGASVDVDDCVELDIGPLT